MYRIFLWIRNKKHIKIGNNVQIAAQSGVLKDIDNDSSVMGHPAIDKFKYIRKYKKNYA